MRDSMERKKAASSTSPDRPITHQRAPEASPPNSIASLPAGVSQFCFSADLSLQRALAAHGGALRGPLEPQGLVYKAALLAQATIRYYNRRYNLDHSRQVTCLVPDPQAGIGQAVAGWDVFSRPPLDSLPTGAPPASARCLPLPPGLATARGVSALQKDFFNWLYHTGTIYVRANEPLKVYAGPDVPGEAFRRMLDAAVRDGLQAEIDKIAAGYDASLEALSGKIERQQRLVDRRQDTFDQRKAEQNATNLEYLTSVFTRRKPSRKTSEAKQRMARQAKGEYDEARKALEALRDQWKDLSAGRQEAIERAQAEWQHRAGQVTQLPVQPAKKDIFITQFGVAWLPYYQIKNPDGVIELAAY